MQFQIKTSNNLKSTGNSMYHFAIIVAMLLAERARGSNPCRDKRFLSSTTKKKKSRLAMGLTQTAVPGSKAAGAWSEPTHLHLVPRLE